MAQRLITLSGEPLTSTHKRRLCRRLSRSKSRGGLGLDTQEAFTSKFYATTIEVCQELLISGVPRDVVRDIPDEVVEVLTFSALIIQCENMVFPSSWAGNYDRYLTMNGLLPALAAPAPASDPAQNPAPVQAPQPVNSRDVPVQPEDSRPSTPKSSLGPRGGGAPSLSVFQKIGSGASSILERIWLIIQAIGAHLRRSHFSMQSRVRSIRLRPVGREPHPFMA
ncbi:hypothetical protein B0T14DRAFT_498743 [Immersiella caudata]|uniref:Uncharacterized protein n=1 Tax=Immersiella caudata TaxID=314043 RepID=A0AA39U704_9PEZI|nr:hypothetical protein B0T14DRAFT_498743 [Immersiella caudata]